MPDARQNTLKNLCTEKNIIRETYYGTTYRATFSIEGESKPWDIMHVRIPFAPVKEAEFMRRFGVERENLGAFYKAFAKALLNHVMLAKATNDVKESDALRKSIVSYKAIQSFKRYDATGKPDGTDLYMITDPMDSFVGSDGFNKAGAYLKTINNLGLRLIQTAKAMNDRGFTIGAIDLDSYYLVKDESAGRVLLKNGYLFYGTGENAKPDAYGEDVTPFIFEGVASGEYEQTYDTDIFAICKLLWALYDGRHYTEPGDFEYQPRYATEEIVSALTEGLQSGGGAYKALNKALRDTNKKIDLAEIENTYIPFVEPAYKSLPLPEPREEAVAPETTEEVEQEEQPKKKPIRKGVIAFVAAAALMLGVALYMTIGPMLAKNKDVEQKELPPIEITSKIAGLYVYNGAVVNADGTLNDKFLVDAVGNIVIPIEPESNESEDPANIADEDEEAEESTSEEVATDEAVGDSQTPDEPDDSTPDAPELKIVFPAERCAQYMAITDVTVGIEERNLYVDEAIDFRVLKPGVVDLRGTDVVFPADGDSVQISDSTATENGIDENTVIILYRAIEDTSARDTMFGKLAKTSGEDGTVVHSVVPNEDVVSESDLKLVKGDWYYKVRLLAEPDELTNRTFTVTVDDPEHTLFAVEKEDRSYAKAKSLHVAFDKNGLASVLMWADLEGRYTFTVKSDDGYFEKKYVMTFTRNDYVNELIAILDTPVPTPEPTPEPTPTPTPTPTPAPVSRPSGGTSRPAPTPEPEDPGEEFGMAPEYTPTFTCDTKALTIKVGESAGIHPSESCTMSASPYGVVKIAGNTVTGMSPGTCVITLTCTLAELKGEQLFVSVTVVE